MEKGAAFAAGVEAAMEKQALIGIPVGYVMGKKQVERGEKYNFGAPQVAATLLVPGGAGYQVGRYIAHHRTPEVKGGKKK